MNRDYVIVCNKHKSIYGSSVLLFWGNRTQDNESRSFSGYGSNIDDCERYSLEDVKKSRYNFPLFEYREGMTIYDLIEYENVVARLEDLEKLGLRKATIWYIP